MGVESCNTHIFTPTLGVCCLQLAALQPRTCPLRVSPPPAWRRGFVANGQFGLIRGPESFLQCAQLLFHILRDLGVRKI